jgi:hypothetical protein
MWPTIREIWAEAMRPEGGLANAYFDFKHQGWKAWIGASAVIIFCIVWDLVVGSMPYRTLVFGWIVGAYFGLVEIAGQGWRGRDTLDDTYFFAIGAAGPLVALHEVETNLGPMLDLNNKNGLATFAVLIVSLLFYAYEKRLYRRQTFKSVPTAQPQPFDS